MLPPDVERESRPDAVDDGTVVARLVVVEELTVVDELLKWRVLPDGAEAK